MQGGVAEGLVDVLAVQVNGLGEMVSAPETTFFPARAHLKPKFEERVRGCA
jgi:hypothetical protein